MYNALSILDIALYEQQNIIVSIVNIIIMQVSGGQTPSIERVATGTRQIVIAEFNWRKNCGLCALYRNYVE